MLKIEEIRDSRDFMKLEGVWNDLLHKSSANTVFLTWEWVSNWWKVYGKNKELSVLTVTDSNDALVGIAPLYIRKRRILKGFTVNEIRFLGSGEDISPDYLDFIIERGRETEIIDALQVFLSSRNQWDVFNLTDMHSDSHSIALLAETARSGRFAMSQSECAVCPYIQLPLSWTDYLGTLSANTRYNVKRRMKNVERDFNSRFFVWEDKSGLDAAMERLASLHNKRWEEKECRHSFSTSEYVSFHKAVARDFAERGWLHLSCLELNGEIVGMLYDYNYNGKIFYYQAGFDPFFYKYSLGMVLRAHVIQKAIAEGIREIDLLKGAYAHKYMWTSNSRKTVNMLIGRESAASRLFFFNTYQRPRMKNAIKKVLPSSVLKLVKR